MKRGKRRSILFWGAAVFAIFIVFAAYDAATGFTGNWLADFFGMGFRDKVEISQRKEAQQTKEEESEELDSKEVFQTRISDRIRPRETLSQALARYGLSPQEIHNFTRALKKEVNPRTVKSGDVFVLEMDAPKDYISRQIYFSQPMQNLSGRVDALELIQSNSSAVPMRYRVKKVKVFTQAGGAPEQGYEVAKIDTPILAQVSEISGRVESSLYDSVIRAGGDASLVNRFADIFGSQFDFYRETRKSDKFKAIVEQRFAEGRFVNFGKVYAAEYQNNSTLLRGFYYRSKDGSIDGMFDEKGQSLQRSFLRSPVEIARITSRYGQRFHPVLGRKMPHNGIDFGAPTGTPFRAVADGVVLEARYSSSAGKMIRLQHKGGIMTEYFHSSRIAPGIRPGARVKQGQTIGYIGTTGRSTGPHLHFGMQINGRYTDPSRQKFTNGTPIPKKYLPDYADYIKPLIGSLKKLDV